MILHYQAKILSAKDKNTRISYALKMDERPTTLSSTIFIYRGIS